MFIDPIEVIDNHLGKAIIASRNIFHGERVLKMSGPIVRRPQDLEMIEQKSHLIQINNSTYYDPVPPGRFINHSCEPNTILSGTIILATRDIYSGEEITFDYSTTMDDEIYTLDCLCSTPSCRGIIRDFVTLPPSLRNHYISLGGVQQFIVLKCSSKN